MKKPKPEKRKRNGRGRKKRGVEPRGPIGFQHPFSNLDVETRRRVISNISDAARIRFEESLVWFDKMTGETSPFHLLASLTFYTQFRTDRPDSKSSRVKSAAPSDVQQGHVEYIQALLLRHEISGSTYPTGEIMQEVFDRLPTLFRSYGESSWPNQTSASGRDGDERQAIAASVVQGFLRAHTAGVRNWGHFSAVIRIASDALAGASDLFKARVGLTPIEGIQLFAHLVRRLERSVSDHICGMREVYAKRSPLEMANELSRQFPSVSGIAELQSQLGRPGVSIEEAKYRVFQAQESMLPARFMFSADEIATELKVDVEPVKKLLKGLSIRFGSLRERSVESLLTDNPVWVKPLIELGQDVYFCAIPQTLLSFVFPVVGELAGPDEKLKARISQSRADYLEKSSERVLRDAFPSCQVSRGFKWMEGQDTFENDLAIRYGSTVLLVESKSGVVSWQGLRGAPLRVLKHVEQLIVAPSDQSARLAKHLQKAVKGDPGLVGHFPIDLAGVTCIFRLSIVLDDFATLQSMPEILMNAGLIRSEHRMAHCLSLADLEVLCDILDSPYLRMHYLRRRSELLPSAKMVGDEIDVLGLYLDTGLNLGDVESGKQHLTLNNYSERIDNYHSKLDEGLAARKPRVNITQWIRRLCDQLMERSAPGWYEAAHTLLGLNLKEQQQTEREVRARAKKLVKGKRPLGGFESILLIPAKHRKTGLVFHMRTVGDRRPASDIHSGLADQVFEHEHVDKCAVFSFRAEQPDLPYQSVSVCYRADRTVEPYTFL